MGETDLSSSCMVFTVSEATLGADVWSGLIEYDGKRIAYNGTRWSKTKHSFRGARRYRSSSSGRQLVDGNHHREIEHYGGKMIRQVPKVHSPLE